MLHPGLTWVGHAHFGNLRVVSVGDYKHPGLGFWEVLADTAQGCLSTIPGCVDTCGDAAIDEHGFGLTAACHILRAAHCKGQRPCQADLFKCDVQVPVGAPGLLLC